MAAACLFVGGKVEEQPKKLRDLLPVVHQLLQRIAGPETTASLEHGGHVRRVTAVL